MAFKLIDENINLGYPGGALVRRSFVKNSRPHCVPLPAAYSPYLRILPHIHDVMYRWPKRTLLNSIEKNSANTSVQIINTAVQN